MHRLLRFAPLVLLLGSMLAATTAAVALDLGLVASPRLETVVLVVFGGFTVLGAVQLCWRGGKRVWRLFG